MMLRIIPLVLIFFRVSIFASDTPYTFDQFLNRLNTAHVTDIDTAIGVLPESLRSHYALVFESQSLQEATADRPRTILYSPDGKLLITFNGGDANRRGNDTIEAIQFKDQTNRFEFHQLTFGDSDTLPTHLLNPKRCIGCHQKESRPNWEAYDFWPGVFGQLQNGVEPEGSPQDLGLKKLFRESPTLSRYRHLIGLEKSYSPAAHFKTRLGMPMYDNSETNTILGVRLNSLNALRIAPEVMALPEYASYKYLISAALLGCENSFGDPEKNNYTLDKYVPFESPFRPVLEGYSEFRKKYLLEHPFSESAAGFVLILRYFHSNLENRFDNWSLVFNGDEQEAAKTKIFPPNSRERFSWGNGGLNSLFQFGLSKLDPELRELLKGFSRDDYYGDYYERKDICRLLKKQSLESLASPSGSLGNGRNSH